MSGDLPIRVLIVDDSAVVRRMLRSSLASQDGIDVIGTAADPFEAHEAIFRLRPDVLTLDIEMPRMDGLTFLTKLMRHHPMPVVVHSSVSPRNSPNALSALSLGAVDVVPKAVDQAAMPATMAMLADAVRAGAQSRPRRLEEPTSEGRARAIGLCGRTTRIRAIGIAASTGGPQAIESILRRIPGDFPCILIVQHLPECFVTAFADRLNAESAATVRVAKGDEELTRGHVFIAPGDRHLSLGGETPRTRLTDGPRVNFHRPSADVLFRAMARSLGPAAVGVILTGMGRDGAAGLSEMFQAGAHTVAEAESSCVVYGMPCAAVEAEGVTETAALDQVADRLSRVVEGTALTAC